MSNPDALFTGQALAVDPVVAADGTVVLKAAGQQIAVAGAGGPSGTQLTTDYTTLTGYGGQVVAAGPARTKLRASATPCRRITVKALVGNTHTLYVGLAGVTTDASNSTGGFQMEPGESFTFGIDDVSKVYIHGTAGEGASFAYEL